MSCPQATIIAKTDTLDQKPCQKRFWIELYKYIIHALKENRLYTKRNKYNEEKEKEILFWGWTCICECVCAATSLLRKKGKENAPLTTATTHTNIRKNGQAQRIR